MLKMSDERSSEAETVTALLLLDAFNPHPHLYPEPEAALRYEYLQLN